MVIWLLRAVLDIFIVTDEGMNVSELSQRECIRRPCPNICSWQKEERKERTRTGSALTLTPQPQGPWQPLLCLPLGTLHGGNQWLTALPARALGPPELTVHQDTTRPKKAGKEETQRNRRIMGDAFTMTAFADLGPWFLKISFIVA